MSRYNAIVIGGGHNGLTAAAWLAKQGRKVVLLESRAQFGGAASTEELFPGFHFNTGAPDVGLLSPHLIEALDLKRQGLEFIDSPVAAFAPQPDGRALTLWQDAKKNAQEIAAFSQQDADAYAEYMRQAGRFAGVLGQMAQLAPPGLKHYPTGLLLSWAKLALKLRMLGGKDMMEFLRVLPMSAQQWLNEHFESQSLKGLLAVPSVTGLMQGPRAAGTVFMLLYQQMNGMNGGYRSTGLLRGGTGALITILAKAARESGAELRTNAKVTCVLAQGGNVRGVELASGEVVEANMVLSSADPRSSFLGLLGGPQLEPRMMRRIRNIKLKGSTASVHLTLSALPAFTATNDPSRLSGAIVISPSLDYAEQAYDDAKHGRISAKPVLEVRIPSLLDAGLAPAGQHTMSIVFRYAPYQLAEGDWDGEREALGDIAIDTLAQYAPNLRSLILQRKVMTPLDYERDYGLAGGSILQGQMGLDQLLLMRPAPGFAGYRSPIDGLYLCGAGAHPGGGVTGLPGLNAARQAHKESR
jgi:phytoene dehydrogenase-like protein